MAATIFMVMVGRLITPIHRRNRRRAGRNRRRAGARGVTSVRLARVVVVVVITLIHKSIYPHK
jgi:hypothetical protein